MTTGIICMQLYLDKNKRINMNIYLQMHMHTNTQLTNDHKYI